MLFYPKNFLNLTPAESVNQEPSPVPSRYLREPSHHWSVTQKTNIETAVREIADGRSAFACELGLLDLMSELVGHHLRMVDSAGLDHEDVDGTESAGEREQCQSRRDDAGLR